MTEGIFYLKLGGKVEGPYTIGQIYDLWAARKINSQTLFARLEEMDKWLPLAELTLTIAPPRPAPNLRPTDYLQSPPTKSERPPRAPKQYGNLLATLLARISVSFEFSIGLCIVTGVFLALYFMLFFPAAGEGTEINQERLFAKQNGVIVGIGLVLMGGILTVARQIKLGFASPKAETAGKSERRSPSTYI